MGTRFSLRTLILFVLLIPSIVISALRWNPWRLVWASGPLKGGAAELVFSSDQKYLCCRSFEGYSYLIDASNGSLIWSLSAHSEPVVSIAFLGNDHFLSSGRDGTVKIHDIRSKATKIFPAGDDGWYYASAPSGGGKVLLANDKESKVLDLRTGSVLFTLQASSGVYSKDGALILGIKGEMEVWIWNGLDGFPIRKLDSGSTWITANVLSGDNSLYGYGDKDGNISVGSIFGNNRGLQFRQGRKVVAISFSPDMSRVASCLPGAYIWDLSNGSLVYEFHHGEHGITSVAFAPQGDYIAIGNGDDTVAMYGRIHPEWWWGHFYQVEVWLSLLFMGLLMSTYIGGKRVQGVPMAAKPSVKAKKEPDAKGTRRAPDPPDPKYP